MTYFETDSSIEEAIQTFQLPNPSAGHREENKELVAGVLDVIKQMNAYQNPIYVKDHERLRPLISSCLMYLLDNISSKDDKDRVRTNINNVTYISERIDDPDFSCMAKLLQGNYHLKIGSHQIKKPLSEKAKENVSYHLDLAFEHFKAASFFDNRNKECTSGLDRFKNLRKEFLDLQSPHEHHEPATKKDLAAVSNVGYYLSKIKPEMPFEERLEIWSKAAYKADISGSTHAERFFERKNQEAGYPIRPLGA